MTTLDSAQQAEVSGRVYRRADFIRLEFPGGDRAYTTHDHDLLVAGVNYTAGVLMGISGIRASADRKAARLSLHLMAADAGLRSAIEGNIQFSRCTYSVAVLDEDGAVITGLIQRARVLVSQPILRIEEGNCTLEIQGESETARYLRPRRVIAGDADQQWRFSGDKGLELVPRVPRSQAEWGGKVQGHGGGGRGSSSGVGVHFTQNLH